MVGLKSWYAKSLGIDGDQCCCSSYLRTTKPIQCSMAPDMTSPQYRSRHHPKLPDLFERLRAQSWEPKAVDTIKDWLVESTTVTRPPDHAHPLSEAQKPLPCTTQHPPTTRQSRIHSFTPTPLNPLPLQPTNGNRAPLPPRATRKRKMSESEEPRQSARLKKMPPPESFGDGLQAKEKQSGPSTRGRKMKKPMKDSETEGGKVETEGSKVEAFTTSKETSGHGPHTLQQRILLEAAASSTQSRSSGRSPSKESSPPSKTSRILNKRERMQYLTPRILFKTLRATKHEGYLTGRLQTLWLNYINWGDQAIVPTAFKVRNPETKRDLLCS